MLLVLFFFFFGFSVCCFLVRFKAFNLLVARIVLGPRREIRVNDGACFEPSSPMWHGENGPRIQKKLASSAPLLGEIYGFAG
jgi:hypothetical protein